MTGISSIESSDSVVGPTCPPHTNVWAKRMRWGLSALRGGEGGGAQGARWEGGARFDSGVALGVRELRARVWFPELGKVLSGPAGSAWLL